jgi:hypothetical protein
MSRGVLSSLIYDPTVVLEFDVMLQMLIDVAQAGT